MFVPTLPGTGIPEGDRGGGLAFKAELDPSAGLAPPSVGDEDGICFASSLAPYGAGSPLASHPQPARNVLAAAPISSVKNRTVPRDYDTSKKPLGNFCLAATLTLKVLSTLHLFGLTGNLCSCDVQNHLSG